MPDSPTALPVPSKPPGTPGQKALALGSRYGLRLVALGYLAVILAVRLRRVDRTACDYDAGGVNVAGAADNGVVIVHWIRVCHCMFPFDG